MINDKKRIKSQEIFNQLVLNAIDFLEHSVSEIEKNPKYSIINFCTAVELFLKSRLMLEHWSLIFNDPKQANLDKFLQGNFTSVGMEGAIKRLKKIPDLKFYDNAEKNFNTIRKHRNQLVHFFNATELEIVATEECKGCFYLSQLLREKWKDDFLEYVDDIDKLDKLMLNVRRYLQAKFNALLPEIEIKKKQGISFNTCPSCGFDSSENKVIAEISQFSDYLLSPDCLVCNFEAGKELIVSCPNCENGQIKVQELGKGECESCEYSINLDYLLDKYAESKHIEKGLFENNRAYCNSCEHFKQPTVVPYENIWLCLSCLKSYDYNQVGNCEFCGELVSGNLDDSFLSGCLTGL
ncbi:hypothetical protein [Dapis sp. BLCC M172]|uniref:hypothetical protein n=1 Tax=Dapis sp. BLCC M172 TaxID=2975281 RepID=UPI003CF78999